MQDLRDVNGVRAAIEASQPQLIFHLAAQAIVQTSYRDPVGTFGANALGTPMARADHDDVRGFLGRDLATSSAGSPTATRHSAV